MVIAIPPDGTLAVDLAIPIQCQVVDCVEGQEVGSFSRPNVVWCYNIAVQLQNTSSDPVLLVCCVQNIWMQDDNLGMVVTCMVIGDLQGP